MVFCIVCYYITVSARSGYIRHLRCLLSFFGGLLIDSSLLYNVQVISFQKYSLRGLHLSHVTVLYLIIFFFFKYIAFLAIRVVLFIEFNGRTRFHISATFFYLKNKWVSLELQGLVHKSLLFRTLISILF